MAFVDEGEKRRRNVIKTKKMEKTYKQKRKKRKGRRKGDVEQ